MSKDNLAKALGLAMENPAFKAAFEAVAGALLDKALDAATNPNAKIDGMSTADLADALNKFSKEELLEMLRKTLMLDKADDLLTKIFGKAVKGVDGLTPAFTKKILDAMKAAG